MPSIDYASPLPREVLVRIFSGLTLQTDGVRNLCASASVCPTWHEAAKEPCLWSQLCVSEAPLNARLTGLRLQNLVARSHNTLSRLMLEGCRVVNDAALAVSVQQQPLTYVSIHTHVPSSPAPAWPTLSATAKTSRVSWRSSTTLASLSLTRSAAAWP